MSSNTAIPAHFFVDAAFGPVNADINAASVNAGTTLTGATRTGADPGKSILFQVAAGEGTGDLLIETTYGFPAPLNSPQVWSMLRPRRQVIDGIVTYTWVPGGLHTLNTTLVNYRVVWVAKQAAASVVINSQLCNTLQPL